MTEKKDTSHTSPDVPAPEDFSDPIAGEILRQVTARGEGKSICPSEVARAYAEERRKPTDPSDLWRSYMNPVRQQAKALARQGYISILRRGRPVDPHAPIKGVIRLSLPHPDQPSAAPEADSAADRTDGDEAS